MEGVCVICVCLCACVYVCVCAYVLCVYVRVCLCMCVRVRESTSRTADYYKETAAEPVSGAHGYFLPHDDRERESLLLQRAAFRRKGSQPRYRCVPVQGAVLNPRALCARLETVAGTRHRGGLVSVKWCLDVLQRFGTVFSTHYARGAACRGKKNR